MTRDADRGTNVEIVTRWRDREGVRSMAPIELTALGNVLWDAADWAKHQADPKAMPPEEAVLMSEMLRQKERADVAEKRVAEMLAGSGEWIGPCAHGRDPWTRCDDCSEAGEPTALLGALRATEAKRDYYHQRASELTAERDALRRKLENERALREQEEWAKFEAYHRENEAVVERDALKARLDALDLAAKESAARVAALTADLKWREAGSPMGGEPPRDLELRPQWGLKPEIIKP
jgi:hypothetical protein